MQLNDKYSFFNGNYQEHPTKPGYLIIPCAPEYAINKEGLVWSDKRSRHIKTQKTTRGYLVVSVSHNNETMAFMLHRLMMLMFNYPGVHFRGLEINHINGIKDDNRFENLEWCTPSQNVIHSRMSGLNNGSLRPIEVRDIHTNEVKLYYSIKEAARGEGFSKDNIIERANTEGQRNYPNGKQYRWYKKDNLPWKEDKTIDKFGNTRSVIVKDLLTGNTHRFEKLLHACQYLSLSPGYLSELANNPEQPVTNNLHLIQYEDIFSEFREIEDPYVELMKQHPSITCVLVNDTKNNCEKIFLSATEACAYTGIGVTTMNYRLKNCSGRVFPDGYAVSYYKNNGTRLTHYLKR